jgi:AAA ATPase domain
MRQALSRHDALIEALVAEHEGTVVRPRGEGDSRFAVFSRASDALSAACAIQRVFATEPWPTPDPLRVRMALHTGEADLRDGDYYGSAVNRCARLRGLAHGGQVLLSDVTAGLANASRAKPLSLRDLGQHHLKDMELPEHVWQLVHPDLPADFPPLESLDARPKRLPVKVTSFVGREHELARVQQPDTAFVARDSELARAITILNSVGTDGTRGRIMFLVGEPGIGKSRLAHELLAHASASGFYSLVGRCFEEYTGVPFLPFAEPLGAALAATPARTRTKLRERWPELTAILADLQPAPVRVDREGAQLRIFRAGEGLLRALADKQPVVLLLEDLHWADSATLGLLLHLGRHLQGLRLLLLGTYRDVDTDEQHPLEATLRELRRERGTEELTLRGLSAAGTEVLMRSRLAIEHIPTELLLLIHERTDGNPFFIEELTKVLVERGILDQVGGSGGSRREGQPIEVPRSVRSVVRHRVERLPPETQSILRVACVLGQEFELDVLLALTGEPQVAVLALLNAAVAARLLRHRQGIGQAGYAFAHALVQQTLYEDLPLDQLHDLHQRASRVLVEVRGGNPRFAAELARHALAAGDDMTATHYSVIAGDFAAGIYAHAEATHHYRNAVELLLEQRDDLRAAEVRCKLGSELNDLNRLPEALAVYAAALVAYERTADALGQARVHRAIGWVHQSHYALEAAEPHLEAAMQLWPAEHEDAEFAQLLLEAARAKTFLTQFTTAGSLAERGLAVAERLNDERLRAHALTEIAGLQTHQGVPARLVLPVLDGVQAYAQRADDWRTLSRLHGNRAMATFFAGDLDGARAEYGRGLDAAQRAGLTVRVGFNASMVALTCMELGAWSDGRSAGRIARAADPRPLWDFVLPWMQGDFDVALSAVRDRRADATGRGDSQAVIRCLTQLADWSLQLEQVADALTAAREAVEFVRTRSYLAWTAAAYGPLAEALARAGASEAEAVLAEAEELIDEREQHYGRPFLLRARGLILSQHADWEGALSALRASATVARAQKADPQLGRTLSVMAAIARSSGDQVLAVEAEVELAKVVERIGPEVMGLPWAAGQPSPGPVTNEGRAPLRRRGRPLTRRE